MPSSVPRLVCDGVVFPDTVSQKLRNNNIFTIAKRNVEGQDMLYHSMRLVNGIQVLAELKIVPSDHDFTVSPHLFFVCCRRSDCGEWWTVIVEIAESGGRFANVGSAASAVLMVRLR